MPERGSIRVTVVGTTDVGRVRDHNEDNLLVADLTAGERAGSGEPIARELGERGFLLAVADGMGGAASGELASEIAVETVYSAMSDRSFSEGVASSEEVAAGLSQALHAANGKIHEKSQSEAEHRGMGTTMTAAFLIGDDLAVAQVGDSRGYLMRKGKLVQVTKDQSLIETLIEDGTLTREEAEKIGGQNIILQALGVEPTVTVDTKTLEILDGDVLVLCSDGLTGMVKDSDIEKTIAEVEDLKEACSRLIALANEGGGRDNITAILVRFTGEGLRQPMTPLQATSGEGAKGGGRAASFAPPPAPTASSSGPSRALLFGGAGGLLLLLLLFFLLSGRSSDVTFTFPAPGGRATLTPAGGKGEPVTFSPPAGKSRVVVPDLTPGDYVVKATLVHYEPYERSMTVSRGDPTYELPLRPLPGKIVIRPGTPRVTVDLSGRGADGEWKRQVEFPSAEPKTEDGVPAGPMTISQSRPGFRSVKKTVTMPPEGGDEGRIEVSLPPLDPILGTVQIQLDPIYRDAKITVTDDYGDEVWSGTVPADGRVEARMRIGTHRLEIEHPRYEKLTENVTVKEGMNTPFDEIHLSPKPGRLVLTGPPGAWVRFKRDGQVKRAERLDEKGTITVEGLAPGEYELVLKGDSGESETRTVTVRSAESVAVRFPR